MTAVVIGGGISGLVAARELVLNGEEVELHESSSRFGGMVRGESLGSVTVDVGAEAFALRNSVVLDLCQELNLEVAEPADRSQIWWPDRGAFPIGSGVLGLPSGLSDDALDVLTEDERQLAHRDLDASMDSVPENLADLVVERLGQPVLDRLVEPLVRGVYNVTAKELPLDQYAPNLIDTTKTLGSLSKAAAALAETGSPVAQPVGGMHQLVSSLVTWLESNGAVLHLDSTVGSLDDLDASQIVIATSAQSAQSLLAGRGVKFTTAKTYSIRNVFLAIDHPALKANPLGAGAIVGEQPKDMSVRSLTHYSAKWPWSRTSGVELFRASLVPGRAASVDQIVGDLSRIAGIDLDSNHVVDSRETQWNEMPVALTKTELKDVATQISALRNVQVVGAWIAGNGLANVVSNAKQVRV